MTVRALLLGFSIALFVAGFTYFNDQVIRQTYLIGNHLPASVFGAGILLVLVVNPLLGLLGVRKLGAGEVAIAVALGLAVCGWPGSNLMRYFGGVMAKPAAVDGTKPLWLAQRTMSYLPGGSALLAEGFVADWPAFVDELRAPGSASAAPGRGGSPVVAKLSRGLGFERRVTDAPPPGHGLSPDDRRLLLTGINQVLARRDFFDADSAAGLPLPPAIRAIADQPVEARSEADVVALNRAVLVAALPGIVLPPPAGSGLLLSDGRPSDAVDRILSGDQDPTDWPSVTEVPWGAWWPTLRLWLGTSLLLAFASLCMVVVVHPQWSQRELLPYPTVKFVEEVTEASERGWLPRIGYERLFWVGLLSVLAIHTLNGLQAWFPLLPTFLRQYDLWGLAKLFPNAQKVGGSFGLLNPAIYFSVIGFGFFISTSVSLSLGLSLVFWVALGALLISSGGTLDQGGFKFGGNGASLRFGAYVGLTLMIVYYGRRYYWGVLRGSLGLAVGADVPKTSIWAARLMVLALLGSVAMLVHWGGLPPLLAVGLVSILMIIFVVLSRLNAETGLFYAQPDFLPGALLIGFLGFGAVGPEAILVLMLASVVLVADPREAVAPYLVNGLRMSQSVGGVRVGRAAGWLAGAVVFGLVVATVATLTLQYDQGLNPNDTFSNRSLPENLFNVASTAIADLSATDQLTGSTHMGWRDHLTRIAPMEGVIPWAAAGVALVLACAFARIHWAAWPIHPVLFVVWGTYPANHFAFSFLLAALVKWAVVKLGGVRMYHTLKPLMIGLIAGELLAVVGWSVVGTIYYLVTGITPVSYRMFPA